MPVTEQEVITALRDCYDPEIPLNLVDLGLIYGVEIRSEPDSALHNIEIEMTLTTAGCPAHAQIRQQVKERVERIPGVKSAAVNVVWTPPWTPERLSSAARIKLGIE